MTDFGRYAWFIWPSYAVFAVLIGGIIVATLRASFATQRRLEQLTDEQGRLKP